MKPVDVWACRACRSINEPKTKRCYKCKTPRALAEVDPATLTTTTWAGIEAPALPPFRPSRYRAALAITLVGCAATLEVMTTAFVGSLVPRLVGAATLTPEWRTSVLTPLEADLVNSLALVSFVVSVAALVGFAFWLSKVVGAMPALGLGYMTVTPRAAIVETMIPLFNLFRVPPILRDVARRLEPRSGRPAMTIAAAWIGIVLGFLLPRVGGYVLGFADAITNTSTDHIIDQIIVVGSVATALVFVGALALIAMIAWIEIRLARRARDGRHDANGPGERLGGSCVTGTTGPRATSPMPRSLAR